MYVWLKQFVLSPQSQIVFISYYFSLWLHSCIKWNKMVLYWEVRKIYFVWANPRNEQGLLLDALQYGTSPCFALHWTEFHWIYNLMKLIRSEKRQFVWYFIFKTNGYMRSVNFKSTMESVSPCHPTPLFCLFRKKFLSLIMSAMRLTSFIHLLCLIHSKLRCLISSIDFHRKRK